MTIFRLNGRRHGLTLIELLVVIGVVAILISLGVPAIQKARAAAARTQCQSNLPQIGLAFQAHHAAHKFFPSGGWDWYTPPSYTGGAPDIGAKQQAGWPFQILPFLEGTDTWRAGALTAVATPNAIFFCPTRRAPQTVTFADQYTPPLTNNGQVTHALCDYGGSNWEGTGIVVRYKPCRFVEITDGTSNTLLVSEKRLNLAELGHAPPDDNEGYTAGWDEDTIRSTSEAPAQDFVGSGWDKARRFGSSHSEGVYAVLADGSVRLISYSIDPGVFLNLGHKSDGKTVSFGDL